MEYILTNFTFRLKKETIYASYGIYTDRRNTVIVTSSAPVFKEFFGAHAIHFNFTDADNQITDPKGKIIVTTKQQQYLVGGFKKVMVAHKNTSAEIAI